MSFKELPVFPLLALNSSTGRTGRREWIVENESEAAINGFLKKLCKGHWPGSPNTVPTSIEYGPLDEKTAVKRPGSLSQLPMWCQTRIVAQYQYMLFGDGHWPKHIPKPFHPENSILTLRVRGSGQFLMIDRDAVHAGNTESPQAVSPDGNAARFIIPLTEYHLTCERLEKNQVPTNFKHREGTVNNDSFLGEKPQTLLFDTFEIDHHFVPEVFGKDPVRFRVSCILRSKDIPLPAGQQRTGLTYGHWNTDYVNGKWRLVLITELNAEGGEGFRLRYPAADFAGLFGSARSVRRPISKTATLSIHRKPKLYFHPDRFPKKRSLQHLRLAVETGSSSGSD